MYTNCDYYMQIGMHTNMYVYSKYNIYKYEQ